MVPERDFVVIASNPPIRAGKQVVYPLTWQPLKSILYPAAFCVVIRTKQGARSLEKYLATIYSW